MELNFMIQTHPNTRIISSVSKKYAMQQSTNARQQGVKARLTKAKKATRK
jgi:hypothetical protein